MKPTKTLTTVFALVLALATLQACSFEDKNVGTDGDIVADGDTESDIETSAVVDVTPPAQWINDSTKTPRAVHLSWQHDPQTTMTVQWAMEHVDVTTYTPKVWFLKNDPDFVDGSEETAVMKKFATQFAAKGEGANYTETFTAKIEYDDFATWVVEMTNLEPDTRYYYRVGTWDAFDTEAGTFTNPNLSEIRWFTTAPEKNAMAQFRFVSAGDSRGGTKDIAANIDRLANIGADFWLFNGDMNTTGKQSEWDEWFDAMQPLNDSTPLMPVQGNHEIFAEVFYYQFALPVAPEIPEEYAEFGWSFDYGNTHFVGLNSNTEAVVEAQKDFLRNDLNRASQDEDIVWIITMFHHPAYSASNHGSTDRVQEHFVPLFEEYGVDLAFAGHDHNYERTHPIRGDQKVGDGEGGVVYVVAGAFYSPGYSNGNDWWTAVSEHGNKGNYTVVEVNGRELTMTAYSSDGQEMLDSFTLTK